MACEDFGRAPEVGEIDDVTTGCFVEAMAGELEAIGFRTEAGFDGLELSGRLWGGNLSLVNNLLGTRHWPGVRSGILFLEDVNEHPYRIERNLLQLHQAGVLDAQKAVVLGHFSDWRKSPLDRGYSLRSAVGPPAQRLQDAHTHRPAIRTPAHQGLPASGLADHPGG